ncbi:MAG: DUF2339 domain-containing protein [Hyphomonas sp.]
MGLQFFGALLVLMVVLIPVGAVLGVIGFAQVNGLKRRVSMLEARLSALPRDTRSPAMPAPAEAPAPPVQPVRTDAPRPVPAPPPRPALPAAARAATAPAPPARPAAAAATAPVVDFEELIASSWMIWVGGIALAIGGLFLVRMAIDAGLFGPAVRTAGAALLGMILIGAGLWSERTALIREGERMVRHLPEVLSGAGIISLYGAAIGAGLLYHLVPPLVALGVLVLVSAGAVALSLKYGPRLAGLGLAGAYVAPLLTGAPSGSALPLLVYAAAISAAGLVLINWKSWRFLTWITLIGAAGWGLIAVLAGDPGTDIAVPLYALALAVIGLALGQQPAAILPDLKGLSVGAILRACPESLFAAHGYWLLAGGLILLTGWAQDATLNVTGCLALYGGAGLLAASRRPGFAFLAPLGALATLAALLVWTRWQVGLEPVCLALGLAYGIGGTLLMTTARVKAPLAAAAALMPPALLFIAFWKGGGLEPRFTWALGAAAIAAALGMMLDRIRRTDGSLDVHPGTASAYAVGAALSAALTPFLFLEGLWLGPAMAVVALVLAAVWRRFPLLVLRVSGMAATALSVFLMIRPGMLLRTHISATPVLNELTFSFAIAVAALAAAAWLTRRIGHMSRAYETGASLLVFSWIGLTIRHIAGGGTIWGPYAGMGEASGYAIAYLGAAFTLAWRAPGRSWLWRRFEYASLAVGLFAILAALARIGIDKVGDLPVANLLLPAFGLPALLLAAYSAGLRHDRRPVFGTAAAALAMATGFAWATLEVMRAVGNSRLTTIGDETWAYSGGWILYAFVLLGWGIVRGRRSARYGSLAVLLVSIVKVFLFDLAGLEGIARAGSFIGLGAALIATALFYQRFVFRPEASKDGLALS